MIEQSVSLASNGVVKVPGYEQLVRFGYTKNRGVYRLHVDATGEWEGLAIRCFWHVPDGKDPVSSLVIDGSVDVPASVTSQPGSGCLTFEGSDGTKTVTSADLRYHVSANSGTEDGTEPEPSTPAWQQLVDAVHTDATAAEQAKTDAQTAAQQSEASAKKAGKALSDTITAKEDALKAIDDKQTAATQAVDTARDKALQQVEASTKAAKTAASEAATSAGNADQSAQKAAGSLQALKDGIAAGEFKGEPGNDGKSPIVTVTDIENGHRVSITDKDGTKTIDVLNGQTGKTGATPVLTIGTVSSGDKPSADITGTPENPVLNLMLQPGPQGPAVALDTTLTHEGEAADAKATGDAIRAVKARQNVLVGTETGNPLSVDDAFPAPLCGLSVYGKSTQDGAPTPDSPVPIVSAGDGGSVAVKVTGKNIFPGPEQPKTVERNGLTFSYKDGMYTLTGTSNENVWFNIYPFIDNTTTVGPTHNGNTIYSDGKIAVVNGLKNKSCNIAFRNVDNKNSTTVITATNNKKLLQHNTSGAFIYAPPGTYSDTFTLMITGENQTEDYEPYHTPQLLTLPTPNGLPGIPVTSGGNYTDPNGQQWVCDEVNLAKGVKVQRVYKVDIAELEYSASTILQTVKRIFYKISMPSTGTANKGYCTRLTYSANYSADNPHFYINEERIVVFIPLDTTIKPKEYLAQYVLATPIEKPLTPAELAAYKALTAYGPDTVVQAGDGAGVKLEYQRDVNLVLKNLEDAVASMTTT